MKMIEQIVVRIEGDVNQFWTFTYNDGTKDEYSAIEGSPYCDVHNTYVHKFDPKLALFLQVLLEMAAEHLPDYDCAVDVTFDGRCQALTAEVQRIN